MLPAVLMLAATTASADSNALPERFNAVYVLSLGALTIGETTRRLYPDTNGTYVYESNSKPRGYAKWFVDTTLYERSEWTYDNGRPQPLSYRYDREGDKKRERHVKLQFNWDKGRVVNNINADPWSMEVPPGTLDKLVYHLALMQDLEKGEKKLEYKIADGGHIKNYTFVVEGEDMIKTDLGKFKTVKLRLLGKRGTLVWCAPALNYLPVRLEQESRHGTLIMHLKSLTDMPIKTAGKE